MRERTNRTSHTVLQTMQWKHLEKILNQQCVHSSLNVLICIYVCNAHYTHYTQQKKERNEAKLTFTPAECAQGAVHATDAFQEQWKFKFRLDSTNLGSSSFYCVRVDCFVAVVAVVATAACTHWRCALLAHCSGAAKTVISTLPECN